MVFLSRQEVNKPKGIFNQYLGRLPPNLQDIIKDIENQTNWLMVEAMRIFDNEAHRDNLLLPGADHHWVVQNFVKLLDSFFGGYWNDFIKQNLHMQEDGTPNKVLLKCGQAYGVRPQDIIPEDEDSLQPIGILEQFTKLRLQATTGDNFKGISKRADARLAHNDFQNLETRQENSLKYLPIWSEAFVITSLVWTFAPIFKREARKELSEALKTKIIAAKSDFGTYQKNKKKAVATTALAELTPKTARKMTQVDGVSKQHTMIDSKMSPSHGKNSRLLRQLTKKLSEAGFQERTQAGLTTEFTDQVEKPLFISDYPFEQGFDMFGCFFNLDSNQWAKFDLEKSLNRMLLSHNEQIPSMRLVQNVVVPTEDSIRYNYVMEVLLTTQKPILVFGESSAGKSTMIKDVIFSQMLQYAQQYFVEHQTCSHYLNVNAIKNAVERNLEVKKKDLEESKDDMGKTMNSVQLEVAQDTGHLRPPGEGAKLIVYLEDLQMSSVDKYNDMPGLEVLRDLLSTSEWYSSTRKGHRVIDDTNLIACIDSTSEQSLRVPNRLLFQFALVGMPGFDSATAIHVMTQMFEVQSVDWPSQITRLIPRLATSINAIYQQCFETLKPTPLKVQYAFNYRECFKFMTAFCKVEGNYLKTEANLVKLFYHECMRQYADKILMRHDLNWFKETLKRLIWETFDLKPNQEVNEQKTTTNDHEAAPGQAGDDGPVKLPQAAADGTSEHRNVTTTHSRLAGTAEWPAASADHLMGAQAQALGGGQSLPNTAGGRSNQIYDPTDPDFRKWPIDNEDDLWFSVMNMDVEGYYCEFKQPETRLSEKIEDLIAEKIEGYLEKYNEQPDKQRISLTLYREFNQHLMKIMRAINMHDGHVIIVGMKGYGIGMLTKLACFASGIQYNKMELHPNFIDEEWRAEMRKNIIYSAGEDKQMAYIADEYRITNDLWNRDLETIIKSNVHSEITRQPDVLSALVQIQIQQQKSAKALVGGSQKKEDKKKEEKEQEEGKEAPEAAAASVKEEYVDELAMLKEMRHQLRKDASIRNKLYDSFLKRVRKNFHVIMNFTPSGANFREKMDKHRQLMSNSQMIWIQNLQESDLHQIGQKVFVQKYNEQIDKRVKDPSVPDQEHEYAIEREKALNPKILKAVGLMYLQAIELAKKYHEKHQHVIYFTPVFFLRTFRTFTFLLEERKNNVVEIQARYDKGLSKIKETIAEVRHYSKKLRDKTPKMQEKQRKLVEIVVEVEEEYQKVRIMRERLKLEELECQATVDEAAQLQVEAQDAIDKITPCIKEALNQMGKIAKHEVADVKTLDHPPRTIKLVMKAICILLEVEPIIKKNSKGQYKPCYWKAAIGPDVLGNPQLPGLLCNYDRARLTEEMMQRVEDILGEADYTYENANRAFKSAENLFKWVKAIRDYFYIFQELQPRHDAHTFAKKQLSERSKELKEKQREIKKLDSSLESLKIHQEEKQKMIDELKANIDTTIMRKRRADTLLKGLNAEQQKWVVCTRMLNSKYDTVQGDVLLAAGYITMAGVFTQKYRLQLVKEWHECLKKSDLTYSETFGFQELFGDNFKIREWHSNQLPPDTFSTDNGLILEKTKRYRLIIDPQQLAWTWIRKQYAGTGMTSTKQTDPQFRRTLELAIDMGRVVLVENLGEKVDIAIESLVRREITKYGNQMMLKFCRRPLKYDSNFDLFILTNLAKPHYDCNITNHVCTVNFFVTVEGLTQNLLSMIVANERPDLEESFNESTKATFENVKLLKETENKILKNLSPNVTELLQNDKLIEVLKESKVCAETVADKLKRINNTNQFLQKTRLMYAPVAVRAANLYFAVTELYQVNKMYQFSMKWFFNVFNQTLTKANALLKNSEVQIDDEDFKLLNHKFSADERIQLLIKSFTQELIRKVIFSCFQDDRQLVTYFMSVKVLVAEDLIDPELLAFAMTGSKKINHTLSSPGPALGIHWMNDVVWAELDALAKVAPFSPDNLMEHIKENPAVWNQLFDHKHISFGDMPNRNIIDLSRFFEQEQAQPSTAGKKTIKTSKINTAAIRDSKDSYQNDRKDKVRIVLPAKKQAKQQQSQTAIGRDSELKPMDPQLIKSEANIGNIMEIGSLKSVTEASKRSLNEKSESGQGDEDDRKTGSRATSKREDPDKVWTTAELLADEDLWHVTDSSEDDSEEEFKLSAPKDNAVSTFGQSAAQLATQRSKAASPQRKGEAPLSPTLRSPTKATPYNAYERNKDYYDDEGQMMDEQEQMARYLVDKAPMNERFDQHDKFTDMQRRTKTERRAIMLREFLLKCQCELAMQRCIRPDLMQQALHKIVGTIYDFSYLSFELDVLAKFIDPDGTLAWRRHKMSQGLGTGRIDGSKNNAQSYSDPVRKSTENNIQLLIKEAYEESTTTSPIFFLVTHSINVFNELQIFYQKKVALNSSIKLHHFQVGKGLNKTIEDAIAKAIISGDWILIENLQLADEWIDDLELIIAKLDKDASNNKFRLFLSAVQMDNCPHMILKQSVKVALQQPTGIKLRMERFIDAFSKDQTWRRGPNYVMHKNMYFALAYLHSVLDGRKMYGPLGWNIYSGFDASDFQISEQQLISYLGESVQDKETQVQMLKYLYANVNFSGKISREEDLRKLNAVINDIITVDIAQCPRMLPQMYKGHYGFPRYDEDMVEWVEKQLPKQDPCEVYGFNRNSERYVLKVRSFDIMRRMYHLNKVLVQERAMGYQDLQYDLESQSIRISLAKSSLHTQSAQHAIIANLGDRWPGLYQDHSQGSFADQQDSKLNLQQRLQQSQHSASQYFNPVAIDENCADALLPLFVRVQKLLKHSSLDSNIKNDTDRFDERVDNDELPMRDKTDREIKAIAYQMKNVMEHLLSERVVKMKLPFTHKRAVQNVFALEIRQFITLVNAMKTDVTNLIVHIEGKYMKPLEIEKLWSQIQNNLVPNSWRKFSFQTAFISLADFVIELIDKIKFWQQLLRVNVHVPSIWIPAFFDPAQYLNALRQSKSREEQIPARMIKNTFQVTSIQEADFENCPPMPNVAYVHGLWLEGASWDREQSLLVEQTNSAIYDKFPVIKVITEMMSLEELDALDGSLSDFEDNPALTKKDISEKEIEDQKIKEQMEREDRLRSQLRNEGTKTRTTKEGRNDDNKSMRQSALGRMNSQASLRESRDSKYNFTRQQSNIHDNDDDVKSRANSRANQRANSRANSRESRRSSVNMGDSDSESPTKTMRRKSTHKAAAQVSGSGSKVSTRNTVDRVKNISKMATLMKQEFAEDSREDESDSIQSSDEEEKRRKWEENLYYYKCPVFRTTLRLRTGEISSDNKPVFYIKLPSLTHPSKWVKRSVALLMETYR